MEYGNNLEEKIIWQGRPSHVINLKKYIWCLCSYLLYFPLVWAWNKFLVPFHDYYEYYELFLSGLAAVPFAYAWFTWLEVKVHRYKISTQRLQERSGIIMQITNDLELFRVKDSTIVKPLILRMFGCGNIILDTSDRSTPIVIIAAIKQPEKLQSIIRKYVAIARKSHGVREID